MQTLLYIIELNNDQSITINRQDDNPQEYGYQDIPTFYFAVRRTQEFEKIVNHWYGGSDKPEIVIMYPLDTAGIFDESLDNLLIKVYAYIVENRFKIVREVWAYPAYRD